MLKARGFTLLEVLLATLIISIGVVTLIWVFSSSLSATTGVEDMDLALNIATAKMEALKNTSFASLASSSSTADANFPNFFTTVEVTGTNPKQVVVTVSWNVKGGSTSIALTTLRINNN
ncbi:MAG: type II secretion system protein [Candidatus Omnitrophota bacterium]|jgi:prepilin-type N-terminal cleavage/methylation domain-containing protein